MFKGLKSKYQPPSLAVTRSRCTEYKERMAIAMRRTLRRERERCRSMKNWYCVTEYLPLAVKKNVMTFEAALAHVCVRWGGILSFQNDFGMVVAWLMSVSRKCYKYIHCCILQIPYCVSAVRLWRKRDKVVQLPVVISHPQLVLIFRLWTAAMCVDSGWQRELRWVHRGHLGGVG